MFFLWQHDQGKQDYIKSAKVTGDPIPKDVQLNVRLDGVAFKIVKLIGMMATQWSFISSGVGIVRQGLRYESLPMMVKVLNLKLTSTNMTLIQKAEKIILDSEGENSE